MMRDVLVEIGQHQEQIQHSLALLRNGGARVFFQRFDDRQRVGQQPFQLFGAQRTLFAASREGVIGANGGLIEKMIDAQLLAG